MNKLIVANWKMYLTLRESVALSKKLLRPTYYPLHTQLVLCPSFVAMEEVKKVLHGTQIKLGAQDVEPEKRGAYTGEVGLDDLKGLGVKYVLIGHSERRKLFNETNALINAKVRAVLGAKTQPILCVGETLQIRKAGDTKKYITEQIRKGLKNVPKKDLKKVVIAYEPIWAISGNKGHADNPEDAARVIAFIKKVILVKNIPVLYGGSITSKNVAQFLTASGIDGLLVGRASTKYSELQKIVTSAARVTE